MSDHKGFAGVVTYAENRISVAISEISAWSIPLASLIAIAVEVTRRQSSGPIHRLSSDAVIFIVLALLTVTVRSVQIRVRLLLGTDILLITNLVRGHRIDMANVTSFEVGRSNPVTKIPSVLKVVFVCQKDPQSGLLSATPITASFSGGKESRLLKQLNEIAIRRSIPFAMSKMIY